MHSKFSELGALIHVGSVGQLGNGSISQYVNLGNVSISQPACRQAGLSIR